MRYDATDYILATKNSLRDLIVQEFPGAAVYMADLDVIPAFGTGGTFCLEAAASAADPSAGAFAPVVLTFRIWSYVEAVNAEAAEGALSALPVIDQTPEDNTITIRNRDDSKQVRIPIEDVYQIMDDLIKLKIKFEDLKTE